MRLIRGLYNLKNFQGPSVVTVGTFDGLHRGHHAVISEVLSYAQRFALPSVVVLFEPHPLEFLSPEQVKPRILQFRDKFKVLHDWGVDVLVCLRFNAQIATLTPTEFVQKLLVQGLHAQHVVVGDDFRFGQQRTGDVYLLQTIGQKYGFTVSDLPTLQVDGVRVSSTELRKAIAQGNFTQVRHLLGRPYTLSGKVGYGAQRGRSIGFPTLNIRLNKVLAISGVYVVRVYEITPYPLAGVANIGYRPTVDGRQYVLEIHLLNYSGVCYGKSICVEFLHKIRSEKKFESLEALKAQIAHDVESAKTYLE